MFRDDLFAASTDRVIEPVETPAGKTFVRTLMVGEKDRFDTQAAKSKMFRAHLVLACCCDEQGRPEFQEPDLYRINDLPMSFIEPIVDAALKLNRIGVEDSETIRKN